MKIFIIGTFDTKAGELNFVKERLVSLGVPCLTVDVSTKSGDSSADVKPDSILRNIDTKTWKTRGEAISEMSVALRKFLLQRTDIGGVISLGGSGGTALASAAFRALPAGLPKLIVSTVASGNVNPYVGASDINMVYSITDINGINSISNVVLSNAAHAVAGMVMNKPPEYVNAKMNIGLTMFGVTTPCVNQVIEKLHKNYECLVFHATGVGGQSMEKLVDSGYIKGVLDITTTEICDLLLGGVMSASEDRMGAVIRKKAPYVGSVGALDMVNFGHISTVPEKYKHRNFYRHNEQVTLMRTSRDENIKMGKWIANKINQMEGEVMFLIPEKGISMLDVEGAVFFDEAVSLALFETLGNEIKQTVSRKVIRLPYAINDVQFSDKLVQSFEEIIH